MRRSEKRKAEECCGYVTELLPQVDRPLHGPSGAVKGSPLNGK